MSFQNKKIGFHYLLDFFECENKKRLLISEDLIEIIENIIKKNNFNTLGKKSHVFDNKSYTAIWLLSESHISIHTWPESNSVYIDIFSCNIEKNSENGKKLIDDLLKFFSPKSKKINYIER